MKRHSLLVLLIAGVFVVATAGFVLADETGWKSGVSGTEEMSAPAPPSSNYEGPVETGSVAEPPGESAEWRGESPSSPGYAPVLRSGGVKFREGIDTGP
ncbi:MAG: hypothetical protein M1550_06555 [Deltaproteobacteria bacterium]|nr:hypothetical protein [Deltaproteobacteria bacterium]